MWLTFAPVPSFVANYYDMPLSSVDWFSMVFFAVSLVVGFVSIFILNKWGLKVSVSKPLNISPVRKGLMVAMRC